jgi:hypothetical protein
MALEDLQSQYGPSNQKGQKGTGETSDPLAFEPASSGLDKNFNRSKYAGSEQPGIKPTGADLFGNIPSERSYE